MPKDTRGSRRRVATAPKRRPLRCGWSGRCAPSWQPNTATIQRGGAAQLGYGTESVHLWVRQADIDEGHVRGVSPSDSARVKALERENRELKRANEILKRAASFFGAELDRQQKK